MSNLLELANNINQAYQRSIELYEAGIETIAQALLSDKEAGVMLIEVKKTLPHGDFLRWIQDNCKFSDRHARNLMNIAKNWEKIVQAIDPKSETRCQFQSPILSLRAALSIAAAEPKAEVPFGYAQGEPPEPVTKYKVSLPSHPCYGETVEVKEQLSNGDVMLCKTSKGEIPFLKKELISESAPLETINAEIIDVEITDISEQLKGAIALVIEYLPENELKAVLAASLRIGKDHLPSDAQGMAARLIGGQEVAILSQG